MPQKEGVSVEKDSTSNDLKKVNNPKRKRIIMAFIVFLLLSGWFVINRVNYYNSRIVRVIHIHYNYFMFEEAVSEFATDVVIVQYVGHRRFGQNLTEFEFVVVDRVLGDAAERIFVYEENNVHASVSGGPHKVHFEPGNLVFNHGTDYLLPLDRISTVYANTRDDGFRFIANMMIDLDNPVNSIMYSEPLYLHTEILDFTENTAREEIIFLVEELTRDNPPSPDFIRSEDMSDIINGSPYVFIIEIGEPHLLSRDRVSTDWRNTDIYHVTLVESLKSYTDLENEFLMTFFADTVRSGQQQIVAVEPIEEGATDWFLFTSRNSLFSLDDLDEIVAIIENE